MIFQEMVREIDKDAVGTETTCNFLPIPHCRVAVHWFVYGKRYAGASLNGHGYISLHVAELKPVQ